MLVAGFGWNATLTLAGSEDIIIQGQGWAWNRSLLEVVDTGEIQAPCLAVLAYRIKEKGMLIQPIKARMAQW